MRTPPLILIADDEPETSELLERICLRAGYQVAKATDGLQTLDAVHNDVPDLLLLDIQMPRLNGWEVLKQLRNHPETNRLPIIVITAAATKPEDSAQGIELGADDYILKPFNYHDLLARVRAKLRARRLEESLERRTEELEALVRLGVDLNRPLEMEPLIQQLLHFAVNEPNLNSTDAILYLSSSENRPAISVRLQQGSHDVVAYPLKDEDIATFAACEENCLLAAEDVQYLGQNPQLVSGVLAPLHHHDERLGYLLITSLTQLGENELRVMSSVSRQAALALRNAQLYEALRGYANELEQRVEARTAELKAAQEQLIRSEKLASLGRLSREIAHEINNPLQPIMVSLDDALENVEAKRPVEAEGLRIAIEEVKRIQRIVKRLLDFARPDRGGVVSADMNQVIHEILTLTGRQLEKRHVKIETELENVPKIRLNPDQIKQVILNLAINAADAMEGRQNSLLAIRLWHDEKYVHVNIKDNGEGIPTEHLQHIFEPFFSTKKEGSGIGLAVSHSLVEAHGGKIDVQSEVGVGTEFRISLPKT